MPTDFALPSRRGGRSHSHLSRADPICIHFYSVEMVTFTRRRARFLGCKRRGKVVGLGIFFFSRLLLLPPPLAAFAF